MSQRSQVKVPCPCRQIYSWPGDITLVISRLRHHCDTGRWSVHGRNNWPDNAADPFHLLLPSNLPLTDVLVSLVTPQLRADIQHGRRRRARQG